MPSTANLVARRAPSVSASAPTRAERAVRKPLILAPSSRATGNPVVVSLSTMAAEARGRPSRRFSGKLEIHLMPIAGTGSGTYAGRAITRSRASGSGRRKELSGLTSRPCALWM
ncbi:hypothetical protein ASC99_22335 [Kitasatospora sp. Root107]|nr:hypothetical protein ASC99_22335 [Kitasatospora sp. Root107]